MAEHLLARLKRAIAKHHSETMLATALRESTAEEWNEAHNAAFDRAKKVSDFIGMLVRIGFVWLAFLFLNNAASKAETWYQGWALGVCAFLAFCLYVVMFLRVSTIVAGYWLRDTMHWKSRTAKVVTLVLGFIFSMATLYGISKFAQAIAKASSLIS